MHSFSRRTLLRSGLAASAGGILLGAGSAQAAGDAVTPRLARGVALGPFFAGHPEQHYSANRDRFAETGTPWVRLWADWPQFQPEPGLAPHEGSGARVVAKLDAQVDAARTDGRRVMLTAWRFARWANGTAALSEREDRGFEMADRVRPGVDAERRKALTYLFPRDLSPGGDWGRWIDYLLGRYGPHIDALEIVNEPNAQLWPQLDRSGRLTADAAVAEMMETAAALGARHERPPLLVGPATADSVGDSRLRTGYDTFTAALLGRLAERGFQPGPGFAWSHHNYTDVENDLAGDANRVARVRAMLTGRWPGWPRGDADAPGLLVTESGARPAVVAERFGITDPARALEAQNDVIIRGMWRLATGPEGVGVGLVCQYLFVTDVFYDSGLCELDGTPRPAYFGWTASPTG
jgi:hypothetical protein